MPPPLLLQTQQCSALLIPIVVVSLTLLALIRPIYLEEPFLKRRLGLEERARNMPSHVAYKNRLFHIRRTIYHC